MEILTPEEFANLLDRLNYRNDYTATIIIDDLLSYKDFVNALQNAEGIGVDYVHHSIPFNPSMHCRFVFYSGSLLNVISAGLDKVHLLEFCKDSMEIIVDNERTSNYIEELLGYELDRNDALDSFLSEFKIV